MSDAPNPPPRRPFGPALFASAPLDWSKIDKNGYPGLAPPDSLEYLGFELNVVQEAEPHYRAIGDHVMADRLKRASVDLERRIAAKQARVDPNSNSPEARARVRWKISARKRVIY
jgi:hypothetical protein